MAGLASGLLTGCGTENGGNGAGGSGIVVGVPDDVLATDPASGYDPGSWLLFNNAFQSLLSFPEGATEPQPDAAESCGFTSAPAEEGISGKVEVTPWSTPSRYGPATDQELKAIAGRLNASGLFDADVRSVPFARYEKDIAAGRYGAYVKGWVPDYPDAGNFTGPFFGEGNVLDNDYGNSTITGTLLPRTAAESDRAATDREFGRIQDIVAEDVPVLPVWQAKQYAVVQDGVYGLEYCLDASTVFRFWELRKA
ncbi:ABC transporter substrate-binding protein [Streptomyces sp. SM1]|uniref:ABC transporter substrate-binding protein n=1 Tax=Streptomyces sp. SM1 TaxID=402229 RepID=UPI0035BC42CE